MHVEDKNSDEPAEKRTRTEETEPEKPFLESEHFAFRHQGQWVTVSYDDRFNTGQVVQFINKDKVMVNYLEQTSGRSDYFKWPRVGDRFFFFFFWISLFCILKLCVQDHFVVLITGR